MTKVFVFACFTVWRRRVRFFLIVDYYGSLVALCYLNLELFIHVVNHVWKTTISFYAECRCRVPLIRLYVHDLLRYLSM